MTDKHVYLWEDIPRDLWARAQAKAKAQSPPMPIKWVLLRLLAEWVVYDLDDGQSDNGPPKARRRPRTPRERNADPPDGFFAPDSPDGF